MSNRFRDNACLNRAETLCLYEQPERGVPAKKATYLICPVF